MTTPRIGRPAVPLITRERAAQAALYVIDSYGLEGFSLELVSRELGVKISSLYHHYPRGKSELLAEVARLIVPDHSTCAQEGSWEERQIAFAVSTRRLILSHPNAAPLILRFFPRHLRLAAYDRLIGDCPLPPEQRMTWVEGTEKLTFGSALFEAASLAHGVDVTPEIDPMQTPHLAQALDCSPHEGEELFVEALRRFFVGLRDHVAEPGVNIPRPAQPRAESPTPRRPRRSPRAR